MVKAMDFRGRRIADAILNTKGVTVKANIRSSTRGRMGRALRKTDIK